MAGEFTVLGVEEEVLISSGRDGMMDFEVFGLGTIRCHVVRTTGARSAHHFSDDASPPRRAIEVMIRAMGVGEHAAIFHTPCGDLGVVGGASSGMLLAVALGVRDELPAGGVFTEVHQKDIA